MRHQEKDKVARDRVTTHNTGQQENIIRFNAIWGQFHLSMLPEKKSLDLFVSFHDKWVDLKKFKSNHEIQPFQKKKF